MARPGDVARAVEIPGPWTHRYVAANGARFHVAEATDPSADGPLVLLLHGFPEFWWVWRAQLPALAEAGYRAVAMDLRGYGGSDKTPRGYDPVTLAQDVSGVVKALGERSAVVVGHGWGGYAAWATAVLHPREVPRPGGGLGAPPGHDARGRPPGPPGRGAAARAGHAGPAHPGAAAGRPGQRLPAPPPHLVVGSRLDLPVRRRGGHLPVRDLALAGLALRAGVPPLARALPGPRRRAGVRPEDGRARGPAGAVRGRRGRPRRCPRASWRPRTRTWSAR